jgi:hypothetical protein
VNRLFDSIPQQDDPDTDPLLEVLQDILDNGGKVPDEVTPRLLMGAIRKTYRATIQGVNTSRRNQIHLWVLTAITLGSIVAGLAIRHNDLGIIAAALGMPLPTFP